MIRPSVHVTLEGQCYRVGFDGDRVTGVWRCHTFTRPEVAIDLRSDVGHTAVNLARARRAMDERSRRSQSGQRI